MHLGEGIPQGGTPGIETGVFIIVNLGDVPLHYMGEYPVHRRQHSLPAAEVMAEADFPLGRIFSFPKALQLFHEQGGIGLPEAVDALLHVPYVKAGEGRAAVAGILPAFLLGSEFFLFGLEGLEDRFLNFADVLVFVHKDSVKAAGDAFLQFGPGEDGNGHMLQIAKINDVSFRLQTSIFIM